MRVLVSVSAGFSSLTDALLADGHAVLGVDNLCTGSLRNLEHLAREPKFEFRELDLIQAFDPGRVDYVFNFASPASPVDYYRLTADGGISENEECAGHCAAVWREVSACIHLGVLGASADRRLLGQREPHWHPLGVRRGETLL